MRVLLAVAGAAIVSACTGGSRVASPTIAATGAGMATAPPTTARSSIEVSVHAATPLTASAQCAEKAARVLAALRGQAFLDSVQVTTVSVSPNLDAAGRVTDYEARTSLSIRTRQMDSLGVSLDLALRTGATSVGVIWFESDSAPVARRAALRRAFEHARLDASGVAEAAGRCLGPLASLRTGDGWSGGGGFEQASVTTGGTAAEFGNVQSGVISLTPAPRAITVTTQVTAEWGLGC